MNKLIKLLFAFFPDFRQAQIHKNPWTVSSFVASRHSEIPISHQLPPIHEDFGFLFPLTLQDILDVGDSEFRVEYALECLLRHGHLRAADVSKLLQTLRTLLQWGIISRYSDDLDALVRELPGVHRCNDGTIALAKV
jgi:hypothetical protein